MDKSSNLQHFINAIDRAHQQQQSFLFVLTTSLGGQEIPDSLTLEFELSPPTLEVTGKSKRGKKK